MRGGPGGGGWEGGGGGGGGERAHMLKRQYRRDELRASGERMGGQILWTLQGETITATIN